MFDIIQLACAVFLILALRRMVKDMEKTSWVFIHHTIPPERYNVFGRHPYR